ncbi:MAG: hypothetical protein PVH57_03610 [Syntrophobacterales bacterium]
MTKQPVHMSITVPDSSLEVRLAGLLFTTGIILSPLTIGNDTLVNYPLSHFLAYLFSGNTPPAWVFLYCYLFTNILGFVFMFLGSGWSCRQGLCTRISRKPLAILKSNGRKIIVNAVLFSVVALPLNYFLGDWIRINIYQPVLSFFFGISFS